MYLKITSAVQKDTDGDGEMARRLRTLDALERTRVHFPAPISGGSQLPVTPVSGDLAPSSGLWGYLYAYAQTHIISNKTKS